MWGFFFFLVPLYSIVEPLIFLIHFKKFLYTKFLSFCWWVSFQNPSTYGFWQCVVSCPHHYSIIQTRFIDLKYVCFTVQRVITIWEECFGGHPHPFSFLQWILGCWFPQLPHCKTNCWYSKLPQSWREVSVIVQVKNLETGCSSWHSDIFLK